MDQYVETIVVGGGQAGLSASWHLRRARREHLVLDRDRFGDTWRRRWDSFCLVTPNWCCQLPGFPYDGDAPRRLHVA
jgi:putative flavoprotein involved in K+ transport